MFYTCHLPKTGGTSLLHSFLSHYGKNKVLSIGQQATVPSNRSFIDLCLRPDPENFNLCEFVFVAGHWNNSRLLRFWQGEPEKLHTFLVVRDPVSLFWSSFYQATIEGRKILDPEKFLKGRSPDHSQKFYTEAYRDLIGGDINEDPSKFFACIKSILHLSNLTESISAKYPELKPYLIEPRRVRSQITNDHKNSLQDDAGFNKLVRKHLEVDNIFYRSCLDQIGEDKMSCRSFDTRQLAEQLNQLKNVLSVHDARDKFRKLFSRKLASLREGHPQFGKAYAKWAEVLMPYGCDLDQIIASAEQKN